MFFEKKRILITVKTYPNPSKRYGETVCCAGIDLSTHQLVRLYPVTYRDLEDEKKFKKYSIIEVDCGRPRGDNRPESLKVNINTIEVKSQLDTKNGWEARKAIVLKLPIKSMCQVMRDEAAQNLSLGLIKPIQVSFESKKQAQPDQQKREVCYTQLDCFHAPKNPIESIPFTFYYCFSCQGEENCKGHKLPIVDWEMGQAYRQWKTQYGTEKELLGKIQQRWLGNTDPSKKDVYFYVGNMHRLQTVFMILGVFYPPLHKQS